MYVLGCMRQSVRPNVGCSNIYLPLLSRDTWRTLPVPLRPALWRPAGCCSELQWVAVFCSVLQCVAAHHTSKKPAYGDLVFLFVCMYVCMYVFMYVCMYVCMCVCMHVRMHVCMHVYMDARVHACMYVCMHVYMCVCMCACMYGHIYSCVQYP